MTTTLQLVHRTASTLASKNILRSHPPHTALFKASVSPFPIQFISHKGRACLCVGFACSPLFPNPSSCPMKTSRKFELHYPTVESLCRCNAFFESITIRHPSRCKPPPVFQWIAPVLHPFRDDIVTQRPQPHRCGHSPHFHLFSIFPIR